MAQSAVFSSTVTDVKSLQGRLGEVAYSAILEPWALGWQAGCGQSYYCGKRNWQALSGSQRRDEQDQKDLVLGRLVNETGTSIYRCALILPEYLDFKGRYGGAGVRRTKEKNSLSHF